MRLLLLLVSGLLVLTPFVTAAKAPVAKQCMSIVTSGTCPGPVKYGASGAMPRAQVAFVYATGMGSFTIPNSRRCGGTMLDLDRSVQLLSIEVADSSGFASNFIPNLPRKACGRVFLQAVDLSQCCTSDVAKL